MKLIKYIFLFAVVLTMYGISGCNKNADDNLPEVVQTKLNVINAVSDISSIDIYLNGTRQNISAALPFLSASSYLTVPVGEQQYQFKNDTVINREERTVLADVKLTLEKSINYSVFLAGQQGKSNVTPILLRDTAKTDTNKVITTAKVRFIQASPGTTKYDVFIGDTVSYKNMAFKSASGFLWVGPGLKKLKVYTAGTSNLLINTTVTVQKGLYYNLLTRGDVSGTGKNAFGTTLILTTIN